MKGKDLENCVFNSLLTKGIHGCSQGNHLVKIPKRYMCKDQRGLYKCIKVIIINNLKNIIKKG